MNSIFIHYLSNFHHRLNIKIVLCNIGYVVKYHENIMHYKMNFLPSTETMINKIKGIYIKYDYTFYDIKHNDDLTIIYNLFIHGIIAQYI